MDALTTDEFGGEIAANEVTPKDAAGLSRIGEVIDITGWVQDSVLLDTIAAAAVATDSTGTILLLQPGSREHARILGRPSELIRPSERLGRRAWAVLHALRLVR